MKQLCFRLRKLEGRFPVAEVQDPVRSLYALACRELSTSDLELLAGGPESREPEKSDKEEQRQRQALGRFETAVATIAVSTGKYNRQWSGMR